MKKAYSHRKLFFSFLKVITKIFAWKGVGFGKIPGIMKVYNFLFDQLMPTKITLIEVQGSKMYVNPQDSGVGVTLLKSHVHEPYETELFKKAIREGMVVVDVGAHIGYYTLMAAKLVSAKGKVYAFEPEPANYRLLVRNIQANKYGNVVAIQKALSNKKGKAVLFLDGKKLGSHSLSRNNVPKLTNSIEVESIKLNKFFGKKVGNFKVNFVKMDAQGAEGLIIEGMSKIIEKNNDLKIMMEFWPLGLKNMGKDPTKLLAKLKQYGFKLQRINREKQSLDNVDINEVMGLCDGSINLWLEKSQ